MKKYFLFIILLLFSFNSFSQFGVSVHQSVLPFAGINYQFGKRILPEFRIGSYNGFTRSSLELTVNYLFYKSDIGEAYGGLGVQTITGGAVLPLGMNIYPFEKKKFGFQMELSGLLADRNYTIRSSWGIRYRFLKEE